MLGKSLFLTGMEVKVTYCDVVVALAVAWRSADAVCIGRLAFQPLGNFGVQHVVQLDFVFLQNAPDSVVGTELDATLTQAVFVEIISGKVQTKCWQRMCQIKGHFGLLSLRRKLSALASGGLDAVFFAAVPCSAHFLPALLQRWDTGLPTFALRRL